MRPPTTVAQASYILLFALSASVNVEIIMMLISTQEEFSGTLHTLCTHTHPNKSLHIPFPSPSHSIVLDIQPIPWMYIVFSFTNSNCTCSQSSHTHTHTHTYTYTYTYTCTPTHVHTIHITCMYVYSHAHTHAHTDIPPFVEDPHRESLEHTRMDRSPSLEAEFSSLQVEDTTSLLAALDVEVSYMVCELGYWIS